jgi:hypothetical protein
VPVSESPQEQPLRLEAHWEHGKDPCCLGAFTILPFLHRRLDHGRPAGAGESSDSSRSTVRPRNRSATLAGDGVWGPQTCRTLPQPSLMSSGHAVVALLWGSCSMITYVNSDGWPVGLDGGRAAGSLVAPPLKPTPATRQRLFWFLAWMGRWGLVPCKACTRHDCRQALFLVLYVPVEFVCGTWYVVLGSGARIRCGGCHLQAHWISQGRTVARRGGVPVQSHPPLAAADGPLVALSLGVGMLHVRACWLAVGTQPLRFGQPVRRVEFKAFVRLFPDRCLCRCAWLVVLGHRVRVCLHPGADALDSCDELFVARNPPLGSRPLARSARCVCGETTTSVGVPGGSSAHAGLNWTGLGRHWYRTLIVCCCCSPACPSWRGLYRSVPRVAPGKPGSSR